MPRTLYLPIESDMRRAHADLAHRAWGPSRSFGGSVRRYLHGSNSISGQARHNIRWVQLTNRTTVERRVQRQSTQWRKEMRLMQGSQTSSLDADANVGSGHTRAGWSANGKVRPRPVSHDLNQSTRHLTFAARIYARPSLRAAPVPVEIVRCRRYLRSSHLLCVFRSCGFGRNTTQYMK